MQTPPPARRRARRGIPLWAVLVGMVAAEALILGVFALFVYPGA